MGFFERQSIGLFLAKCSLGPRTRNQFDGPIHRLDPPESQALFNDFANAASLSRGRLFEGAV